MDTGPLVHFASVDDLEDRMTTGYLRDTAEQAGLATTQIAMTDIGWDPARQCLVDLEGRTIATLFKLYPWEGLTADTLAPALPTIATRWIEPAWKMCLSNKAILPILWEMFPDHPNLLAASRQPIGDAWVKKPLLGREGSNVTINAPGISDSTSGPYEQNFVYQTYAELGAHDGMHPVIGSWLVGDSPAGHRNSRDSRSDHEQHGAVHSARYLLIRLPRWQRRKLGNLEKAIEADPDNLDAWSVYADWLQAENDPRGELAAVQLGFAKSPKDKALLASEKKLMKEHRDTLIGAWWPYLCRSGKKDIPSITAKPALEPDFREYSGEQAPFHIDWRAGFIKTATIAHPGIDWSSGGDSDEEGDDGGGFDIAKLVGDVLGSPAARFMTGLRLGMPNDMEDGEMDFTSVVKALAKSDALERLRSLYIGDISREESEVSWISIGDISKLYPKLGKLRSLTLRGGGGLKLGKIDLPELRELTIITGGMDKKNIASLAAAKWPKLEKLELWLGTTNYGGNCTVKDLKPILDGKAFPKLTSLGLRNCEFADELAVALGSAKVIGQLKKLDLSKGTLTDTGVEAMIESKDAFSHLAHLDLSDNYLAKSARTATQIIPAVRTKPQRSASEYDGEAHRYVALGE